MSAIQIPINITTGYAESGSRTKDDILRIDQTSYYLASLFWFMNTACKGFELLDIETEHKLFEFHTFRGHVEHLSELGIAIAEGLTGYSVSLSNADISEIKKDVSKVETKSLSNAEMISYLINNEFIPAEIREALSYAVTDISNRLPPDSAARGIENAPEYIQTVLSDYADSKKERGEK